ncbi:MAG: Rne/Rng family ribonuclease [Gemmatimonadetes bacterium]|nr:Rne/Rng family ribonuclease [Gemmatimonadota bacterium]
MKRQILINAASHETRVAILEDGALVELMLDRPDSARMVGDIYLGRVEAVLPGIQAAFVDIGADKAAFLHVSDLADEVREENGEDESNGPTRLVERGRYPAIQTLAKKGQPIVVQVTKEPIGTKGPRVTAQISLPGRFLVYMPESEHIGVSRKIEDRPERVRLRSLARELLPPGKGGVIIRTVGEELTRETFQRELSLLTKTWEKIHRRASHLKPPTRLHREAKLTAGLIRDVFSEKVDSLLIDNRDVYHEVRAYLESVDPDLLDRVQLYDEDAPLFDRHGIEEEIRKAFERNVDLPGGGYIVIEPTEALVSIDVNTGRYTGRKEPEKTILRTNLEAAREIARELRLRDIGGIIVCDFIDMEDPEDRERVLQELRTHLGRDRARTKAFEITELGLVQITRQRVRPSLYDTLTQPCPYCRGGGRVFTPATVVRRIERAVRRAAAAGSEGPLVVRVHPAVALHILEEEPDFLRRLRSEVRVDVQMRDDPLVKVDEFRLLSGRADVDLTARYAVA